jgi:chaperonin GroES
MVTYRKSQSEKELDEMTAESLSALDTSETKYEMNEDGSLTVDFIEQEDEDELNEEYSVEEGHYANLVSMLDEDTRKELAQQIITNVQEDDNSRREWLETIKFGLDLLGVTVEEKDTPFAGACSAQHPLLMESAVKFQSKASNELLPPNGPVKTKILGDKSVEKEQQANRVKEHMNYQITEQMTEFYPDSERNLLYTSLVGSGFKKTYYNFNLERPCSEFIPAHQFIVPNASPDLYRAIRYTHVLYKSENDIEADCAIGLYTKPECGLGKPQSPRMDDVTRKTSSLIGLEIGLGNNSQVYTLFEQHLDLYIDQLERLDPNENANGYKVASPYVVTVDSNTQEILSIRRNWKEGDKKRRKKVIFTHYSFVPSFNFYAFGYLHLLGNLQLSLTSALRSLVDAGQFANLQGGFKLKGVRIVNSDEPIYPGQFKEIESHVMDINKAIMPLPFKEPSNVLYQMLGFLDTKGQKFADSTEQVIADSVNYGPVGTTMALLEASTKFFSAIHKRLHNALKNELRIIAEINAETLEDDDEYNIENMTMKISRKDYDEAVDVIPVSDPNMASSAHRMAKAQTMLQLAQQAPSMHDMREVYRHVYTNMDYADIDKIMPKPEQAQPNDPMTDIQLASQGKPIKAFPGQDHQSHIALKQAFIQNPQTGQSPFLQAVVAAIQANIQEHLILQYTEQVQAMMQQAGQQASPEQVMAQAAQQVAQLNTKQLQQQVQAQEQAKQGEVPMLLAKAEMLDTQTQARKQAWVEQYQKAELALKKAQLDLDVLKEKNKAVDTDKKLEHDMKKKGLDTMIESMKPSPKKST